MTVRSLVAAACAAVALVPAPSQAVSVEPCDPPKVGVRVVGADGEWFRVCVPPDVLGRYLDWVEDVLDTRCWYNPSTGDIWCDAIPRPPRPFE